jgi:hypothetical protein
MSGARGLAYVRYQLSDYLMNRAALPVIMIILAAGLPLYAAKTVPAFWHSPDGAKMALGVYKSTVTLFLPLGAFLAAANVISVDRQQAYVRFYFSKPVSVLGFYGQQYVVHGVAYALLFAAITALYGAATSPLPVAGAVGAAVLTFVLVGSLGFFLGTLNRFDGGILALAYLIANVTQGVVAQTTQYTPDRIDDIPRVVRVLATVLPPVHKLDVVRTALYDGTAVDPAMLGHIFGYAAGAVVLGVICLRRLPLSR